VRPGLPESSLESRSRDIFGCCAVRCGVHLEPASTLHSKDEDPRYEASIFARRKAAARAKSGHRRYIASES